MSVTVRGRELVRGSEFKHRKPYSKNPYSHLTSYIVPKHTMLSPLLAGQFFSMICSKL